MRVFYFVGGPTAGNAPEFFRRLAEAGGPPPSWRIYEATASIEIIERPSPQAASSRECSMTTQAAVSAYRRDPMTSMTLDAKVQDFLAQKRIAVAGVSRDNSHHPVGNLIYQGLKKIGHDVFPANHAVDHPEPEGDEAIHR